ncbi:hypothetical protein [Burkholderia diffusa]|uniref:hypothetical protein n=1 Tax=Burkholderia diffusa TaxID=488732 RepID=UPI00158D39CB|nr:hypothetical protein [Burkholderia diffusa]
MRHTHLFDDTRELIALMRALTDQCSSAPELMRRLDAQRRDIDNLGKFARHLNRGRYDDAKDILQKLAFGLALASAEELETMLLRIELDFSRASALARPGASAKRFDRFWSVFDALAKQGAYRDAESLYRAVLDTGIAPPHPRLSTAKEHYRNLKESVS